MSKLSNERREAILEKVAALAIGSAAITTPLAITALALGGLALGGRGAYRLGKRLLGGGKTTGGITAREGAKKIGKMWKDTNYRALTGLNRDKVKAEGGLMNLVMPSGRGAVADLKRMTDAMKFGKP